MNDHIYDMYPPPETEDTVFLQFYDVRLTDGTDIEVCEPEDLPKGQKSISAVLKEAKEDSIISISDVMDDLWLVPRRSIVYAKTTCLKEIDAWRYKMIQLLSTQNP